MKRQLPMDKPIKDILLEGPTFEDIGFLINKVAAYGLQSGGVVYALTGTNEGHIRDGILIAISGKIIDYGYDAVKYLKEIYKNSD